MPLVQALRELGMPLYMCQPPTGYSDRADAWVNTGALLNRMNFAVLRRLASRRPARRGRPGPRRVERHGRRSRSPSRCWPVTCRANTRQTVAKATTEPQKIALLLGSPDFQKR